jgi:hypothetical protein
MTSTGQQLLLTTTKNPDGSDASTFTAQTPTFKCNLQEVRGNSLPLPFSDIDLAFYKLFTPYTIVFKARDRVTVDGITYEVQDTDLYRSPDQISHVYLISRTQL